MTKVIEINIEIDTDEKVLYIGEICSSGVEEHYESIKDISNYLHEYLEEYHRNDIVNRKNKSIEDKELFD